MERDDALKQEKEVVVAQRFHRLADHSDFSEASLKEGLSKKPRVIARLNTAIKIFSGQ